MNIITFTDSVELRFIRSIGQFSVKVPPYVPHVFARPQYGALTFPQIQQRIFKTTSLGPRLRPFYADGKRPGSRVLLYNGSGGFGDQILTWPVGKILADMGYNVYVLSDPGNEVCWHMFDWVKGIYTLPVQFETLKLFDHYALFEIVVNTDDHQDQMHPVDTMLNHIGIDPDFVDPRRKVVAPNFSGAELDEEEKLFSGKDIAIYQLHTGSSTRSLTPSESCYILRSLAKKYTNFTWIAICDNLVGDPYKTELSTDLPENVVIYRTQKIRILWSLTQRAKVVVAPDSMMVHIAGSLGVPCVGLWGMVDPAKRTRYYENHIPIWPKNACGFSPCFSYLPTFPTYCPPHPDSFRTQCEVMTAITKEMVIDAVEKAIILDPLR